ncbi:tRNA uridine(34) 5-carboxymethylaminomethyl modification radical SAM/GNAT enzyme Elp3 [Candidatus Micrarchaeota archaeon CG_4_10_14_0_2_um_filter_55_9]|nr:MAG: hypothetical protein AUJ15_04045 [Candidatus Micrarchaeota archaeon CG1_02_55_41]PIO02950.1 MAG: tRNA uridine(34) 5-carboxymethylaminomethyl modification radical SAM/GNAT enzyme Elp3 [Candidatus Micrarchaeota archaeon CG09_land_8_20_14_0_10_55_25]PIZ92005.1 MAG: tRNA uridine(34) 5-carboxymethylaminomethyl modification radical SAM/GNAT enzyme Elp3 [Candidatus Micrarchaeota archaeon CG_4_10_14_0_2_um_filter_55_9]PJD01329.1 MAG: tRNA uridine(34) 5-carboxymethylaminomethyl modification radic
MNLEKFKHSLSKERGLKRVLSSAELAEEFGMHKEFKTKKTRSSSGVSVVAIMTRPYACPGRCTYCPTSKAPKSYTGEEPAARRAKQNDYDAFKQVESRLRQLEAIGHEPSKCELIVMGGTFNYQPVQYQNAFIKKAFDAFNGAKSRTLKQGIKKNERAEHRVIGLTIETRPDWCTTSEVKRFLGYGCTRIELGVQSLDEEVLEKVRRGHGLKEVAEATRSCKDAFLKVCYHFMPGLYSTPEKDAEMMRELFADERFKPDMLKIYPCLVVKGSKIYGEWRAGRFQPYDTETAARAVALCKAGVPEYCRIMRVERDIPTPLIEAGPNKSNLREIARKKMKQECKCIRCREVGRTKPKGRKRFKRINYRASQGEEVFLSIEDDAALHGFVRLRRNEDGKTGVRELRIFGEQTPVGEKSRQTQHRGLGARLLAEAEEISRREWDSKKMFVLSGVGVRDYYRKHGYKLRGAYMVKGL